MVMLPYHFRDRIALFVAPDTSDEALEVGRAERTRRLAAARAAAQAACA